MFVCVVQQQVAKFTSLRFLSLNTILVRRILLSESCTVIFRMCSGLSCCFAMCFKCFGVLFFSVRLISSVVLHVRLHVFIKLLTYLLTYLSFMYTNQITGIKRLQNWVLSEM